MPPAGFEPTISADQWPQTYALDSVAIGTGLATRLFSGEKKNYLKSTFFQLQNVLFRPLNGINRHSFVSKTKSKTTCMKKVQSPQKLFQKHDDEMRYEI